MVTGDELGHGNKKHYWKIEERALYERLGKTTDGQLQPGGLEDIMPAFNELGPEDQHVVRDRLEAVYNAGKNNTKLGESSHGAQFQAWFGNKFDALMEDLYAKGQTKWPQRQAELAAASKAAKAGSGRLRRV